MLRWPTGAMGQPASVENPAPLRMEILDYSRSVRHRLAGLLRHTSPSRVSITNLPSTQPKAMKKPHTNQTRIAFAVMTGGIIITSKKSNKLFAAEPTKSRSNGSLVQHTPSDSRTNRHQSNIEPRNRRQPIQVLCKARWWLNLLPREGDGPPVSTPRPQAAVTEGPWGVLADARAIESRHPPPRSLLPKSAKL